MKDEALPFFSVIVPTYERPAQLASCLAALARLDYPRDRFEVVVVDDGSARAPEEVVGEFRESLDVSLYSQENAGPGAARNFGSARARGEFLAFTDDDCAPGPGWLRAFASAFGRAPGRIVGGRTLNALEDNLCAETSQTIIEVVYAHFNADPEDARFFASNNFAVPAEAFRELRGFDESFRTSEDREICDRWRSKGLRLAYAPDALVFHAHPLTLRTLWRQHFGYGRGARRLHAARAARGQGSFKPDKDFYLKLLRAHLTRAPKFRAARLTALLLWTQLANAVGFFYERRRRAKSL